MSKLKLPARIGSMIFKKGTFIEFAQEQYKTLSKGSSLPKELICLSCLATQSTQGVLNRGNECFSCGEGIDPYNLSSVEV